MKAILLTIYNYIFPIILRVKKYYHRHNWHYNHTGKIALCCIAKMENLYIREFVSHYKELGFDKIFIYDNNDIDGERFDDIIGDYIQLGYCDIIDYRGRKKCQILAYDDCYNKYKNKYDWIAFFDCDEFLTLVNKDENIHSFLKNKTFLKYQIIALNWMVFGDNELLTYDSRNLKERFAKPVIPYNFKGSNGIQENNHIKTIVRCNLKDVKWVESKCGSHAPFTKYIATCNANGKTISNNQAIFPFDHSTAYLRHYSTKTIEEFILGKKNRGFPDSTDEDSKVILSLEYFFRYNKITEKKIEIAQKLLNKNEQ